MRAKHPADAVALITSFAWREGTLFAVASLWGDGSDSEGGPQAFYAATVAGSRRLPDRPVEAQDRWESVTGGLVLYDYEQPEDDEIGRAHVRTPATNAPLVCRLPLEQKNPPT